MATLDFRRAMHWEHRFNNMVHRYNEIYRVQMPSITPHVCRHTYCSSMARSGMNPKTLQYLMGHSDIGVTMNTYYASRAGGCAGRAQARGRSAEGTGGDGEAEREKAGDKEHV